MECASPNLIFLLSKNKIHNLYYTQTLDWQEATWIYPITRWLRRELYLFISLFFGRCRFSIG